MTADHVRSNFEPGTFAASATVVVMISGGFALGTARRLSVKVLDGCGVKVNVRGGGAPDWRTPTLVA